MALILSIILACNTLLISATPPRTSYGSKPSYNNLYCSSPMSPVCLNNSTVDYCLQDPEYPEYEIKGAISADYLIFKKYADVGYESDNLVDIVSIDREASFNYDFYTGASTGPYPYDATHWAGGEGYICPSSVLYAMPKRARNVQGKWQVIVNNVHFYSQSVRMETCLYPEAGCRALTPCYASHCTQKYYYHQLLSWDPCDPYKGLFIDIYKLPSACSCYVPA
ncbi:unnamed protein product [Meganyctiphanes norvegica]|uniref:Spaetzle domain-containing protein n=1 Tax=Meganyctiphanes norvegica TaxID=48144 RepID=A0AAV2R073_MEGNR